MNQVEESGEEAVVASLFVDERPSLQENLLPFGVHRNTAPEKDEMPHASPIKEMNVHDAQAEADMVPVRQLIAAVQPVRRRSVANVWRNVWGVIFLLTPARFAYFATNLSIDRGVSGPKFLRPDFALSCDTKT